MLLGRISTVEEMRYLDSIMPPVPPALGGDARGGDLSRRKAAKSSSSSNHHDDEGKGKLIDDGAGGEGSGMHAPRPTNKSEISSGQSSGFVNGKRGAGGGGSENGMMEGKKQENAGELKVGVKGKKDKDKEKTSRWSGKKRVELDEA